MHDFAFLRRHPGFIGYGFSLKFASSFGQTFFISLSVAAIGLDLGLSDADTGFIYSFATLSSAALLPLAGQWIDRMELRLYSLLVCAGMVAGCLTLATVDSVPMLFVGFLLVRLFGQGLLGHTAATAMARYFGENRGKALSIAALGFPLGEAILPRLTVGVQEWIGWRETWYATGALLAALLIPVSGVLLRRRPAIELEDDETPAEGVAVPESRWTRGRLFRDPKFLLVLPVVLTPPFIGTGVFWHQIRLCEAKGWSVALFATAFAAYAISSISVSLLAGVAVDRLSARRCLVGYLVPQILALLVLATVTSSAGAVGYMVLAGATSGAATPVISSLWAEFYGVRHLGAIRSAVAGLMVFSTACAPGPIGWLLDQGAAVESLALGGALIGLGATVLAAWGVRIHGRE